VFAQLHVRPDAALRAAREVVARLRSNPGAPQLLVATDAELLPALESLVAFPMAWGRCGIWAAHELVVPDSHATRRWPPVWEALAIPATFNVMPIDPDTDPSGERAATRYAAMLAAPPCRGVADVAFLLLRADGGIAGLPATSPLLRERGDVAAGKDAAEIVGVSVTLPLLARARAIVLLAAPDCTEATVTRVVAGDPTTPAGRLRHPQMTLYRAA
jgi:6-phosphogluconolactonase/glucosamine-6-phosphate isomerase/deaminase